MSTQTQENKRDIADNKQSIRFNRQLLVGLNVGIVLLIILVASLAHHECKNKITLHEAEAMLFTHITGKVAPTQEELKGK